MKPRRRIALIEFLIVVAIALIALRLIFASELRSYERELFAELGVSEGFQVSLVLSLALAGLYLGYRRGRLRDRVPRWLMIGGFGVVAFGVGAVAWLLTA